MKSSKRIYGVPFYKIIIPLVNNDGDCIGRISIRSKTPVPFPYKGAYAFEDIDGEIYPCTNTDWHNCGIADSEKEMNDPYG